ncbi:hypothetical protein PBS_11960 [Paraburkholderia sp. 2C]
MPGIAAEQLDHLYRTYAELRQPAGVTGVPTLENDRRNAQMLEDGVAQNLTGYPREVAQFEQRHAGLLGQLAAIPASQSRSYAAGAATFAAAYRMATREGRAEIGLQFGQLESAVLDEYNRALNDPLTRVLGVFNTPVGAGHLDRDGQHRVGQLARMRRRFLAASTPAQRESLYQSALSFKTNLQSQISDAIGAHLGKQAADWKAANDDIDRMLGEAERIRSEPGKRYELIGRQLHTSNPGSGEDPFEERRILAFTQRMQDDPALRAKLAQWDFDAGKRLNSFGMGGQKRYEDIANDLPAAGPDYVRDLADRYDAVLSDSTAKDQSITPQARATRLAGQILEGTARVLLGMTPFAPLTAVLDEHSSLPPGARLGIDVAAGVLGMAIEPANAVSGAISDAKTFAQAIRELDTVAELGHGAEAAGMAPAARPLASALPIGDPGLRETIPGRSLTVPTQYASNVPADSLQASADVRAMRVDENGHTFVPIGGQAYPARYDANTGTARVYDANNPWKPSYPVRLNSKQEWVIGDDAPLRLRGGGGGVDGINIGAGPSAAPPMSRELKTALEADDWQSPADAYLADPAYRQTYQSAFDKLGADQQRALKRWTALDETSASDSDSSGNFSDSGSRHSMSGLNYDLNEDLRAGNPPAAQIKARDDLASALAGLPSPTAQEVRLLRVADVPAGYASRFKPGDLVTDKGFLAASSSNQYLLDSIADGGAVGGSSKPAMAIYDIKASSAKPFIPDINTDASNENEWLMRPGTVFRVDEIATLVPADSELKPRIGLRLTEVPVTAPVSAKDIYSGRPLRVSPGGHVADEAEAEAGPAPPKRPKTDASQAS